ncbi:MAG TPA: response regulator [Tahibacter sp.]|uniref:response regulator n=1 Tax=Tahibacter sp. TaxID=2056211 RepID=UPI002CAE273D|nr:response regulator [Tahibacter sp.]HSX60613.1 response regulator [Tahibacter sp.]
MTMSTNTSTDSLPPSPPAIVVVDDHLAFAETLATLARLAGCTASIVEPRGVLETAACIAQAAPDLVFLDVSLAHFDGCEVVAELRRRGSRVRFVAITGDWRPETAERCRDCGFDEVWHKPIDPARLESYLDAFGDETRRAVRH